MMCADAEDTFSKANQRALGLRSQKKSELLSRARSKLRTTSTHHAEEEKQEKPRDVMESSNTTTTDIATPRILLTKVVVDQTAGATVWRLIVS